MGEIGGVMMKGWFQDLRLCRGRRHEPLTLTEEPTKSPPPLLPLVYMITLVLHKLVLHKVMFVIKICLL
jgi:hypothetical protein